MSIRKRIVAATPLLCLIAYLVVGFVCHIWHPTWLIFLLVPVMPMILGLKKISITYPIICVIVYLVIGFSFQLWHPGWLIFLTIPVFYIFFPGHHSGNKHHEYNQHVFKADFVDEDDDDEDED